VQKRKRPTAASSRADKGKRGANPARRKRRSSEDILSRIVRAATAEFKRNGYSGTTTAMIARKADVTEAQLFRYFGSKANLFRETIFKPLDQQFDAFAKKHVVGKAEHAGVVADLANTEMQKFISEHIAMLTSLVVVQIYDAGVAHGVGKIDSLSTFFNHSADLMKKILPKPEVPPDLMVRLPFATVLAAVMFKDWIFPPGLASDKDIQDAINTFVREGISANFGRDRKLPKR
jgi:AcrR family transcriptional regulator